MVQIIYILLWWHDVYDEGDLRNHHDFSVILNDPNTISAIILGHYYIHIPAPKNSQGRNYVQQGNPISMNFYGTSLRETFPESSETVWVEKMPNGFGK